MSAETSVVQPASLEIKPQQLLAWSMEDSWLGLGLVVFILIAAMTAAVMVRHSSLLMPVLQHYSRSVELTAPTAVELAYVVPVLVILAWRRADWLNLGFRKFDVNTLAFGCGLTALTYMALLMYGAVLAALKITTQGDTILELLKTAKSPLSYVVGAVIAAPIAEEVFFRGFLFQGLRQRYGWNKAALLSSLVFGIMHFQLVALIPTFLLGYVFAFVYHRSNSIWPGVILHFIVNSFGMCALLAMLPLSRLQ